jgi:Kef-type K+ transport system membrane component KefB
MNRRVSFWLTVIVGVGVVLDISGWILRAIFEVRHGHGAETFVNAKGMQVHWVDVLTMSSAAFVATLVMLVATMFVTWRKKRDAALIKKLEARDSAESDDQAQ